MNKYLFHALKAVGIAIGVGAAAFASSGFFQNAVTLQNFEHAAATAGIAAGYSISRSIGALRGA